MKIIKNEINIGIEKPFTFLHMSDTHLCLADDRDNERKNKLAAGRTVIFPQAEENLEFAIRYATDNGYMIAHTGDLIDFVSCANLDAAERFTDATDCFMAAGNHEFSQYVGEAVEDAAYRNQSLDRVQASFKNDIRFCCREVNGINLVAIDNSYYLFEREQLDALKAVAEQGKPILLFMHTPLYTKELHESLVKLGAKVFSMMSVPEELMSDYPQSRYKQQKEDAVTAEAFEYIKAQSLIKGLLVGHLHFDHECTFGSGIPQLMTGCNTLREITVK